MYEASSEHSHTAAAPSLWLGDSTDRDHGHHALFHCGCLVETARQHGCAGGTGTDGVDPDATGGVFDRGGLGETSMNKAVAPSPRIMRTVDSPSSGRRSATTTEAP